MSGAIEMDEDKLLPCPFCGGRAIIMERGSERQINKPHYYYVNCVPCDCEGSPSKTKRVAWEAWNHRFPLPQGMCLEGQFACASAVSLNTPFSNQERSMTKSKLARYRMGDELNVMLCDPAGDFVLYEQAVAEIERLRSEVRDLSTPDMTVTQLAWEHEKFKKALVDIASQAPGNPYGDRARVALESKP